MGQAPTDERLIEIEATDREVDALRRRTQAIVAELERRLADRLDRARDRLRRIKRVATLPRSHPALTVGIGLALSALVAGIFLTSRRRDRPRLPKLRAIFNR